MSNLEAAISLLTTAVTGLVEDRRRDVAKFDEIRVQLGGINTHLDQMDARFDRIDTRLDAMDTRFERLEATVGSLDTVLGLVADEVRIHSAQLERRGADLSGQETQCCERAGMSKGG
jgi:archaellum component FlaC